MNREGRYLGALHPPRLHWQTDGTPHSTRYADIYYSSGDGPGESEYTFVAGSGLPQRWRHHPRAHFCIIETGFGTGLNFLLTWRAWRQLGEPRPDLHYLGVERHPLQPRDLARCHAAWPELAGFAGALAARYPPALPGRHRLLFEAGRVRLDLCWGDAGEVLSDLCAAGPLADAWFLDGFAPARNADMWSPALLASTAALSRPGATVATFSAAGSVRRALQAAGFDVRRVPGYGRKREALRGSHGGGAPPAPLDTPWDLPDTAAPKPDHAMVLGGGLAGCFAAFALARRGIAVTLLDGAAVAGACSGNDQGVLYTRVSQRHSALVDFALLSFGFAARLYADLLDTGALLRDRDGALCGALQLAPGAAALTDTLAHLDGLAQVVDAGAATRLLGIDVSSGGYWFPQGGWLHPPAVCRALLQHANIEVREHCGTLSLQRHGELWRVAASGTPVIDAPCAVIAAGTGTATLAPLAWLPLHPVRGQTTDLPPLPGSDALRGVLCHEGYIAPPRNGQHCIGATFDPGDTDIRPRTHDHVANLAALATAVPTWEKGIGALDPCALSGRVGIRCTTPDYLPAVGPVPDAAAFAQHYAALRADARRPIPRRGSFLPGLYLSAAHGSRGLTSAPLAGELLASAICDEPPPLERDLCRAIAPARFLVRDLARGTR